MSNRFLLPYYPLVDFIADFLGPSTEVVLHDFTNLERSVVKIRNGHISGRKEGDPATDLVMKKLNREEREPYVCNYKSMSRSGKELKSGSFFIRDNSGNIVGMLCLNLDIGDLQTAQRLLDGFICGISAKTDQEPQQDTSENLGQSINEIIDASIERSMEGFDANKNGLTMVERETVVARMNEEGVFLFKGAIPKAAAALDLSESSLYRYLKKVRSRRA